MAKVSGKVAGMEQHILEKPKLTPEKKEKEKEKAKRQKERMEKTTGKRM